MTHDFDVFDKEGIAVSSEKEDGDVAAAILGGNEETVTYRLRFS